MINLQEIKKNLENASFFTGNIKEQVSMKDYTTFKIGGNADIFICPNDEKSMTGTIQNLHDRKIPFFILGGGSNIVVSDDGITGAVIHTSLLDNIQILSHDETTGEVHIRCSCGCSIDSIIHFCIENELTGLETFAGLPGTIGGALYMNARCYDYSISEKLISARYCKTDNANTIMHYTFDSDNWGYKKSPFQSDDDSLYILSGDLKVYKGIKKEIQTKCDFFIQDRKDKGHFNNPCAGSVFKNNRDFGKSSGEIIDSLGLKGFQIGNAQIAPWHGNLIINLGCASADDIKEIVNQVHDKVQNAYGYNLESEILFIGKFS